MKVNAMSDQTNKQAAAAIGVTPKDRRDGQCAQADESVSGRDRRSAGRTAPAQELKLKTGMFSNAAMRWPQAGLLHAA
jgi:hypothetical protein